MRSQLSFEPHSFIRPPSRSRYTFAPFGGHTAAKSVTVKITGYMHIHGIPAVCKSHYLEGNLFPRSQTHLWNATYRRTDKSSYTQTTQKCVFLVWGEGGFNNETRPF